MSDPAFAALVASYTRKLPLIGRDVQAALEAGDLAQVAIFAHRLRGTAVSYGFPELGGVAAAVEDAIRAQQPADAVRALVETLVAALSKEQYQ